MWRNIASNGLTILIVAMIAVAGLIAWGKTAYRSTGPLEQAICLKVDQGASMTGVSADLARQGAVSHGWLFRLGADYSGRAPALKAGSYLIAEGASMEQIVTEITGSGRSTCGTEVLFRIGVTNVEIQVRELDPTSLKFEIVAEFDPREGAAAEVPDEYRNVRAAGDTRYRVTMAEGATVWQVAEALRAADFLAGNALSSERGRVVRLGSSGSVTACLCRARPARCREAGGCVRG